MRRSPFAWHGAMILTAIGVLLLCANTSVLAAPIQSLREIRYQGIVLQRFETSCGAAAIATVLSYAFHDVVTEWGVELGKRLADALAPAVTGGVRRPEYSHLTG